MGGRHRSGCGVALHQRVVVEAGVVEGIGHREDALLVDGVGAEGDAAGGLLDLKANLGLEPLAVVVDQTDEGDRSTADLRSD